MENWDYIIFPFNALAAWLGLTLYVVLHELGHAIPALIWTRESVKICIGFSGGEIPAHKFRLGRLEIYLKKKAFFISKGLCSFSATKMTNGQRIFTYLNGSLFPLLLFTLLFVLTFWVGEIDYLLRFGSLIWLGIALVFTLLNLNPGQKRYVVQDYGATYNDGFLILSGIRFGKLKKSAQEALEKYWDEDYAGSYPGLLEMLDEKSPPRFGFQSAVDAAMKLEKYEELVLIMAEYQAKFEPYPDEWAVLGFAFMKLDNLQESILANTHCLQGEPGHFQALANRGLAYLQQGTYEKAKTDLEHAFGLQSGEGKLLFSLAYCQAALGNWEAAEKSMKSAKKLAHEESELLVVEALFSIRDGKFNSARNKIKQLEEEWPDYHWLADDLRKRLARAISPDSAS